MKLTKKPNNKKVDLKDLEKTLSKKKKVLDGNKIVEK